MQATILQTPTPDASFLPEERRVDMDLTHDNMNAYVHNFVRHPHPILDTDEAHQLRQACLQRLRPGGLLVCDNALRGGRVMASSSEPSVQATQAFIEALWRDPQLDTSLIPIRDGILVCRKSSQ